mmetsp:Transcript_38998/g.72587  ORF Transcript_38998/g.72587 Transcript_38998/m.72587 type:complete len:374 (-) Transcript_38998:119-1240(-)
MAAAMKAAASVFMCMALPTAGIRRDAAQPAVKVVGDHHHLTWSAGDKVNFIGFEVELVFGYVMNAVLWPAVVDTALGQIEGGMRAAGLKAAVSSNKCRCTKHVDGKGYVLPLLFQIKGINDFDVFNSKSLAKVKATSLAAAIHGLPGPDGMGFAEDGESVEAKLRQHPEVGEALKRVTVVDAGGMKLMLTVELWQTPLAAKVGDASDAAVLLKRVWEKITSLYWQKLYDSGVDAMISGVETAQDQLPKTYAEAKRLSDQGPSACIAPPDFDAIGDIDSSQVGLWKGSKNGQDFLGLRAAITIVSINANIENKLADLRNDVMEELMSQHGEDLPGKLQAHGVESNAVPCGWTPEEPSVPPLPHDASLCSEPPTF